MLDITNPTTGEILESVEVDTPEEIAQKYQRARSAQLSWQEVPLERRCVVVERFRDLLQEQQEDLARILTQEMGKPITQSRGEIRATKGRLDFFLEHTADILEPRTVSTHNAMEERVSREPLGVIANISAWNYPYFVGTNVFVPALLTGNSVLYKPSEHATLTGMAIARLWREAGLPDDVFIPVIGDGNAGKMALNQPVDAVFFTGSYATGCKIAAQVAPRLIRTQLELGGKDPVYVCDDVDAAIVAHTVAEGAFYNTGQSCCSVERVYVHEKVYDAFVEAFVEAVKSFKLGDPMEETTFIGPIARRDHVQVLHAQVQDALGKGAETLVGGHRVARPGAFFEPTVLVNVDHSMEVMREESFGPVIGIQRVQDDHDALYLMQDTSYGLTASVFSSDEQRAKEILSHIKCGTAYWNCCDRVSPRLPWSGRGHSGMGATLGRDGIEAFVQPKAWHMKTSN